MGDSPKELRTGSRELYLAYRRVGAVHQAFFPDAAAIRPKVAMMLSRHPHLRGVKVQSPDVRIYGSLLAGGVR